MPAAAGAARSGRRLTSDTIRAGTNPSWHPPSGFAIGPLRHETEVDYSKSHDFRASPTPARTRKPFLYDPQLLGIRPAPRPASIYNKNGQGART